MEQRLREILHIALKYRVSDIHFNFNYEKENEISIEMRVNGNMRRLKPTQSDLALFRFLMYRANLDITSVFDPQTGSFSEEVDGRKLSLRFALVTSASNTSGVLRILNNHHGLTIDDLSKDEKTKIWLKSVLDAKTGLYIFSGPTGSGKTTTLYTLLNSVEDLKIFTIEDPIEVFSDKYIQLQVNPKQQLSYAQGIKQLMRHDPDVIMIGEIRDEEAAKSAVRCALTGHLVITSLHASSCASAIYRMLDLGVSKFQLQDVLQGISNQRLFADREGKKFGVYEIMDKKEIDYFFANEHVSADFIHLQTRIDAAVRNGILM